MDPHTVSQDRRDEHDYSEFAQEFLRRNKAYREQFARARQETAGAMQSFAAERVAGSWGLEFPFRSEPAGASLSSDLAL